MPIDYLKDKKGLEQQVEEFLANESKAAPLQNENILSSVAQSRGDFLGKLALPQELVSLALPKINRQVAGKVARSGFDRTNSLLKERFNQYMSQAQDAGLDIQQAQEFARKKIDLEKQQDFSASEAQLSRDQQLKNMQTQEDFVSRGLMLQDQYSKTDPNLALARILAGTVGLGSSYYFANNAYGKSAQPQSYQTIPSKLNSSNSHELSLFGDQS